MGSKRMDDQTATIIKVDSIKERQIDQQQNAIKERENKTRGNLTAHHKQVQNRRQNEALTLELNFVVLLFTQLEPSIFYDSPRSLITSHLRSAKIPDSECFSFSEKIGLVSPSRSLLLHFQCGNNPYKIDSFIESTLTQSLG